MQDRRSVRVVVVGAGVAGLSTARHLLQAGFPHVTLLEASNRVGGRIRTEELGGTGVVEMGAGYIHGASDANPVYSLVKAWGLLPSLVPSARCDGHHFYLENGEVIDKSLVEEVWKLYQGMEDLLDSRVQCGDVAPQLDFPSSDSDPQSFGGDPPEHTLKEEEEEKTPGISVAQFVEKARPRLLQRFAEGQQRQAADRAFHTTLNYCCFTNGDCLENMSADLIGQYKTIPGPEMTFTGNGYGAFLDRLREGVVPDSAVQLNREVTQIRWSAGEGEVPVEVVCRVGEANHTYGADHVVLTCPLGHLKAKHRALFHPPLPEGKTDAIQRRGFGRVAKVFLHYDQPVTQHGVQLAWRSATPAAGGGEDPSHWLRHALAFFPLPGNPNTLHALVAGEAAEIVESLSEETVARQSTQVLRQVLQDPSFPEPSRVLKTNWISHPLFKGGYSYPSTHSVPDDVQQLAAPLPSVHQPRLLFAGEATHPDYYSTVHGAYLSGVREAQRLIEIYK